MIPFQTITFFDPLPRSSHAIESAFDRARVPLSVPISNRFFETGRGSPKYEDVTADRDCVSKAGHPSHTVARPHARPRTFTNTERDVRSRRHPRCRRRAVRDPRALRRRSRRVRALGHPVRQTLPDGRVASTRFRFDRFRDENARFPSFASTAFDRDLTDRLVADPDFRGASSAPFPDRSTEVPRLIARERFEQRHASRASALPTAPSRPRWTKRRRRR
jgi:hypothetical protein